MNAELAAIRDETGDLQKRLVHDIERLPGVLAAAVWFSGPLQLRALHVTASPRASGLIIANAAAQVLRRHGLAFEMDMIRVAFGDGNGTAPQLTPRHDEPAAAGRFLLLHDIAVTRSGSRITCAVALRRDELIFEGKAVELDTDAGRVRAAARATLAAAERSSPDLALGLEGTALLESFGRRYVAASVEAAIDRRFALLAGLVPIDPARSPEEAACLAALSAIDRWIAA